MRRSLPCAVVAVAAIAAALGWLVAGQDPAAETARRPSGGVAPATAPPAPRFEAPGAVAAERSGAGASLPLPLELPPIAAARAAAPGAATDASAKRSPPSEPARARGIRGRVIGEDGRPVAGAVVLLAATGGELPDPSIASLGPAGDAIALLVTSPQRLGETRTDGRGAFELKASREPVDAVVAAVAGNAAAVARLPGHPAPDARGLADAGTLSLRSIRTVSLDVTGAGLGLPDADVGLAGKLLVQGEQGPVPVKWHASGSNVSVRTLVGVSELTASARGFASERVELEDAEVVRARIDLWPAAVLEGVVTEALRDRPVSGAAVRATETSGGGIASGRTGPDGRFSLALKAQRDFLITVSPPADLLPESVVARTPGAPARVVVGHGGRIVVDIALPARPRPTYGLTLARPSADEEWKNVGETVQVGRQQHSFSSLAPGRYRVTLGHGLASETAFADVQADRDAHVHFRPRRAFLRRVVGPDGRKVAGLALSARTLDGRAAAVLAVAGTTEHRIEGPEDAAALAVTAEAPGFEKKEVVLGDDDALVGELVMQPSRR